MTKMVCGIKWKVVRIGEWRSSRPTRTVSLDPKGGWWASHVLAMLLGEELRCWGETFSAAVRGLLKEERKLARELRQPK